MSKRSSDGEVLYNRLAVSVAQEEQGRSLLASLLGGESHEEPENETRDTATEDDDLIFIGDFEQFGVGAKIPKEIENGTFTSRVPTTDDKLLQQLIGKKAAKAHLDAKRASKNNAKQPAKPQPAPKKEESEDEEEGRASAFKSKRRKQEKTQSKDRKDQEREVHDDVVGNEPSPPTDEDNSKQNDDQRVEDSSSAEERTKRLPKPRHQPSKPVSYLDQLLAERSKKKKKKSKADA